MSPSGYQDLISEAGGMAVNHFAWIIFTYAFRKQGQITEHIIV